MGKDVKRVTFNVPVDLMDRVDVYADSLSINRTSAVCVLLSMALDGQKAMKTMDELLKVVKEEQSKQDRIGNGE